MLKSINFVLLWNLEQGGANVCDIRTKKPISKRSVFSVFITKVVPMRLPPWIFDGPGKIWGYSYSAL